MAIGRGAADDRRRVGVDRHEVAGLDDVRPEVEPGLRVVEDPPLASARGEDGLDGLVGVAWVAVERDLVLVLGLHQIRPVLGRIGDRLGVGHERHDAVVVAVPGAVGRLGRSGIVSQVETLYGSKRSLLASPKAKPTSTTSGFWGPGLPTLALMASISSPEPASGSRTVDVDAVLGFERLDHFAVVAPVVRQGDGGQRPSALAAAMSASIRGPRWRPLMATRRPRTVMRPRSAPPRTAPSMRPAHRPRPAGRRPR